MDHLADATAKTGVEQHAGATDVDRGKQLGVLREGHLRDVVEDDINARQRVVHRFGVPDVALDELDTRGPVVSVLEVEHAHVVAAAAQLSDQQQAEVAAAAGDQRGHRRGLFRHGSRATLVRPAGRRKSQLARAR